MTLGTDSLRRDNTGLLLRTLRRLGPSTRAELAQVTGLAKATVSITIGAPGVAEPIAARPIDPPTLAMSFGVNDSPYAGREGDKVQSRVIRDRLEREAEGNVAIKVTESAGKDAVESAITKMPCGKSQTRMAQEK